MGMELARLIMDIPSTRTPSACCPSGLLPTQQGCTLITLLLLMKYQCQLLDYDTAAWVVKLPIHDFNFPSQKLHCKPRLQHLGQPSKQKTKCNIHQTTCVTTNNVFFNTSKSAPFLDLPMPCLAGASHLQPPPCSSGTPFESLSLALKDEEDKVNVLMAFSLSPNTTAPLHVPTKLQHSKTKCHKSKTFYSKPNSHATLT